MDTPGTSRSFKKSCVSPVTMSGEWKEDQSPPASNDDERKLLNIFPEEIWLKILGSVNPPDLETVNNASPFFRRLLYPDRTTFLFSSVWKVLGVQYEYDSDSVYCDQEVENGDLIRLRLEENEPFFSVILKLRLVCREWCLAVDKFYQDLYSYDTETSVHQARVESGLDSSDELKIERVYNEYTAYERHWKDFKFLWAEELENFMEHFSATHDSQKSPFPFRKVILDSGDLIRDEILEYCSKAIQMLTKYGHHIWFCEIDITNVVNSWLELFTKIQEMLTLMPNLKDLRISLATLLNSEPGMTNCVKEQMKEALVTHPVPRFESLRMLSFWRVPTILMEHIVEKNDHVEKLEMKYGFEYLNLVEFPLPHLTHLTVRMDSVEDFELLEQWGPLWQLEMLHLKFLSNLHISDSRIFKCLEQWKNSLTDVVVTLPRAEGEEDKAEFVRNIEMRLDLPRLKRLRLLNIRSFDLILPLRNTLELLEYSRDWKPTDREKIPKELLDGMKRKEVIQFHSVENDDMYKSNIWSLFPKLGRIHVWDDITDFYNGPAYIRRKMKTLEDQ